MRTYILDNNGLRANMLFVHNLVRNISKKFHFFNISGSAYWVRFSLVHSFVDSEII